MHTYIIVNCGEDIKVSGDREEKYKKMKKKKSPIMTDEKRKIINCTTDGKRQVKGRQQNIGRRKK